MAKKTQDAAADDFTVEASEGIVRTREKAPNPLESHVLSTLENGPLKVAVRDDEHAKRAMGLVRRAAAEHGLGVSVQYRDGAVHFQAKAQKRSRKYTDASVREWAKNEGYSDDDLYPRIHPDIRQAFKVANGYAEASPK